MKYKEEETNKQTPFYVSSLKNTCRIYMQTLTSRTKVSNISILFQVYLILQRFNFHNRQLLRLKIICFMDFHERMSNDFKITDRLDYVTFGLDFLDELQLLNSH